MIISFTNQSEWHALPIVAKWRILGKMHTFLIKDTAATRGVATLGVAWSKC